MKGLINRGALIVFEGLDRTGKSTQSNLLTKALLNESQSVSHIRFPDRTTAIGSMINDYLMRATEMDDHSIHLLFSANRWEKVLEMKKLLASGTTLVVDRYAYSGVAFSSAKENLDLQWCCNSDIGLPQPDCVFFLHLNQEAAAARGDYGKERYEKKELQEKVYHNFLKLKDDNWKIIDADKSPEELHSELLIATKEVIERVKNTPLQTLWTDDSSLLTQDSV